MAGTKRRNESASSSAAAKKDKKAVVEEECPFTDISIRDAFGQEVHTFLHCHLRGYDQDGLGESTHAKDYDKYGAPVMAANSWMSGYHAVERKLAEHFNRCINTATDFPLVAGLGGGAHLYEPCGHDVKPWNWTGFVPKQDTWVSNGKFFRNRYFVTLRGNEIQNNLWDYHPHDEDEGADDHDHDYVQISPKDKYRGGYWYKGKAFGRYLHIVALKTHVKSNPDRYNYVVHPLAYRSSLTDLPDSNVDGIQKSIMNIDQEENILRPEWGGKCHGMEVFNDFTYYYSWNPSCCLFGEEIHNGEIMNYGGKLPQYQYWFDTYPFEYCEFLVDTALRRGCYLHILSANDAFYERATVPPTNAVNCTDYDEDHHENLMSDPKGCIIKKKQVDRSRQNALHYNTKHRRRAKLAKTNSDYKESNKFMKDRPYGVDSVFGYTTLIDTRLALKDTIYGDEDDACLESGEIKMIQYLKKGQFFSHTGVYDLFEYGNLSDQVLPFVIQGQEDTETMCYEVTGAMEMVFTFPPVKDNKSTILDWKYQLEVLSDDKKTNIVAHGFFEMDTEKRTRLDLTSYNKANVKFVRFTAFHSDNPMKRAWFNPVRGPAFASFKKDQVELPNETRIEIMETDAAHETHTMQAYKPASKSFAPTVLQSNTLDVKFDKCADDEEENMYCYIMEVCAPQQAITPGTATEFADPNPPERISEYVQGYFSLNNDYPTRLNLSNCWDSSTLVNSQIMFFSIDRKTATPQQCVPAPKPFKR